MSAIHVAQSSRCVVVVAEEERSVTTVARVLDEKSGLCPRQTASASGWRGQHFLCEPWTEQGPGQARADSFSSRTDGRIYGHLPRQSA